MTIVAAPSGWGFIPGAPLSGVSVDDLPDMPMLKLLGSAARNSAIVAMLQDNPFIASAVRPSDLQRKYEIAQSTASVILARATKVA